MEWINAAVIVVLLFVVCFLLGSIPWGLIISRVFFHKDIRNEGSGNIGTTNAMRTIGKKGGAAVFVLDFGKGLLSGFIAMAVYAQFLSGEVVSGTMPTYAQVLALSFAACTFGHIFSPWLGFKGGKGIAVAVGCLFVLCGVVGAVAELLIFAVVVAATRYVSAGSIAAAVACPFFSLFFFWGDWVAVALVVVTALTVIWAHRGNIERLRAGNERRIGSK